MKIISLTGLAEFLAKCRQIFQPLLVSGQNIKTINSTTLLGSWDIAISGQDSRVDGILEKIPNQASSSNQLADKAFVNSSVQTATANFRGVWSTWANVPTSTNIYPEDYAGSRVPTVNDYLVVQDASGYQPATNNIWTLDNATENLLIDDNGVESTDVSYVTTDYLACGSGNGVFKKSADASTYARRYINAYDVDKQFIGNILVFTAWTSPINIVFPQGTYYVRVSMRKDGDVVKYLNAPQRFNQLQGTWRFKYSGLWATLGKTGWLPEYQVNEEPFTSAQLAAINSGITSTQVAQIGANTTAIAGKESASNKVILLDAQSTDAQYPSAKCVYEIVGNIESTLQAIRGV